MKELLPTTPYLIRAIYEWCCDSGQSPFIAVLVDDATRVPLEYVKDGEIVLNVSPDATRNLKIDNDFIRFSARFNGVSQEVSVPIGRVRGIFARETGQGLAFQVLPTAAAEEDTQQSNESAEAEPISPENGRGRAKLQIVK